MNIVTIIFHGKRTSHTVKLTKNVDLDEWDQELEKMRNEGILGKEAIRDIVDTALGLKKD